MNFKTNIIVFVVIFVLAFSAYTEYRLSGVSQELKEVVVNANNSKPDPALAEENFVASLATPKDTFNSHLKALANNDEVTLYRTYSPGYLNLYQTLINSDDYQKTTKGVTLGHRKRENIKKWGEKYDLPEITFEKIEGNGAYLEYKTGLGGTTHIVFIKEGNDWKIATLPEYRKTEQTIFKS